MNASALIDSLLEGQTAEDVVTEITRSASRPRKRRFGRRGSSVNPVTGKRKDPRRRLKARKAARRGRAKRKMAARRFARSAKGRRFHKKLGKLIARIRRR